MDERFETAKANVKEFARNASDQAKRKAVQIGEFVKENKELVIMCVPAVAAMVKTGQSLIVSRRAKVERSRIDHTYYDPSTGFHWELRRKPTNADRAEILKRKAEGVDTYDILKQMRLIK